MAKDKPDPTEGLQKAIKRLAALREEGRISKEEMEAMRDQLQELTTPTGFALFAARMWIRSLRKYPIATSFSSALVTVLIALVVQFTTSPPKVVPTPTYVSQVKKLDDARQAMKDVDSFLEKVKKDLEEKERIVQDLEKKKADLDPIIESKAKTVDAIFAEAERRSSANEGRRQWVGFWQGVGASFLAWLLSLPCIYWFNRSKLKKLVNSQQSPDPPSGEAPTVA